MISSGIFSVPVNEYQSRSPSSGTNDVKPAKFILSDAKYFSLSV